MKSFCYYTTPEYRRTFWGKYIYIYQSSGNLELDNTLLQYTSKRINLTLSKTDIKGIGIGRISKWAKPLRLEYLIIRTNSTELNFVPTNSALTPVWVTNGIVAKWHNELKLFMA
jgi:hypothetical protein